MKLLALLLPAFIGTAADQGEDILAKMKDAYTKLNTYADQGMVIEQSDRTYNKFTFTTYRRKPKDFFYQFNSISSTGTGGTIPIPGMTVWWMRNGDLELWDRNGKRHESFPAGSRNQVAPISTAGVKTHAALPLIAALVFPKAGIVSDIGEIATISYAGTENIAGHKCFKLVGIAQSHYPSGQTFNTRPVALWIDGQTYLLRKYLSDTPRSYAAGEIYRVTITMNPIANPSLDDAKFDFKIPEL